MISRYKTLSLILLAAFAAVLLTGCNDSLRQFIVPIPRPGGDVQARGNAVVLSSNPSGNGSTMHIDVSGDTLAGVVTVGPNPVFLGKAGASVFAINGDGTITTYLGLSPQGGFMNTITPFPSISGIVAGGTSSSGNFFTANHGSNNVGVVTGSAMTQLVQLAPSAPPPLPQPVAIAGNAANSKIYVVNQGTNTVTVISTTDNTVIKTIPVGMNPIWAVMSANGVDVFVVNQGDGTSITNPGSVSVIDTTLDAVIPCTPGPACDQTTHAISVGFNPATSQPNFAFYDPNRQRLYVSNTGEQTVSVIRADGLDLGASPQVVPGLLANIQVSGAPVSVAALNDGSKAYAALGNCKAGTNHTNLVLPTPTTGNLPTCTGSQVSVIDAVGLRETDRLTVGAGVVSVDVSGDALHAYAVAATAGTVADIRVATNSVLLTFPAPQQNLSCANPAICPANVTQTPFMVRIFP
jgi:YVTN family beta-propeller protein